MTFIAPMLAHPPKEDFDFGPDLYVVEEKYDGIRIVADVAATGGDLFGGPAVTTYSRYGRIHVVPPRVREALAKLPSGIYDGEIYASGKRSYGTAALANAQDVVYVIFDVLELLGKPTVADTYEYRRSLLQTIFRSDRVAPGNGLELAWAKRVDSMEHVHQIAKEVWARDGEGLIIKRITAPYRPGKRDRCWMKVKQLRSAVLTLVGFAPGKMGPFATAVLRDAEGQETTVKWKNLALLAYFGQHNPNEEVCRHPNKCFGRRVRIEFQERTPDGGYRHPRWDRWEDDLGPDAPLQRPALHPSDIALNPGITDGPLQDRDDE